MIMKMLQQQLLYLFSYWTLALPPFSVPAVVLFLRCPMLPHVFQLSFAFCFILVWLPLCVFVYMHTGVFSK